MHDPLHLVLVGHLGQAARQDLHGAPGHAAVGVQPLVDHDVVEEALVVGRVVGGQEAPGVGLGVLAAVQQDHVGGLGDLLDQLGDGAVGLAGLVALHVPGVLDHARDVQHQPQPVPVGQRAHRAQIGQTEGVLAVGEALHAHDGGLALA